jgi:hypothetical protein
VATYTTESVTLTIRRWIVPAVEPWGATAAEISKAWAAAELDYRRHRGIPQEQPLADDALRFRIRDGEIVISFEFETPS